MLKHRAIEFFFMMLSSVKETLEELEVGVSATGLLSRRVCDKAERI